MIKKIGDIFRTLFWILSVAAAVISITAPDWYMRYVTKKSMSITRKILSEED
jgi:hypothetical protein